MHAPVNTLDDLRCAPRNFIRPSLLLLLRERRDHGYGLAARLRSTGIAEGNPGAIYRTLRALERTGLVASGWSRSASGPPKRIYSLTSLGEDALESWTEALRETHEALDAYLSRYERHVERAASGG
jgi:PadR family transcriptional regulator, regulatory protein PadR